MYRIFNSGIHPFEVVVNNDTITTVHPRYALDISCQGVVKIKAPAGAADTDEFAGIYDQLSDSREVRSGRFNTERPGPTGEFLIIDLRNNESKNIYRIFNSGKKPFDLKAKRSADGAAAPVELVTVKEGQSIDLIARKSGAAQDIDQIWIYRQNNGDSIEGIYDYLGSE
ncbi:hypothetical protein [Rubinisphaera margarita]|uniref:hypothetical protein n=1 Tax=Rubinisphaera margarita TaxID=2909586 RepID=UPI001EE9600D|nr:hypothetical protein [Rubinisphaera margarita]MCG6156260.1 hypothetical protein [Rubinisphaera margarita]